jgi:hypothetical protein
MSFISPSGFASVYNALSDIKINTRKIVINSGSVPVYDTEITDQVILLFTTTDKAVINIRIDDTLPGRILYIKHSGGIVPDPITIETEGSALIDGNPTLLINEEYGCYCLVCDGENWAIISKFPVLVPS